MLLPPLPARGTAVELRAARAARQRGRACDIAREEIQLAWRGRSARVTFSPDVLASAEAGPGEALRDLSWWQRFREELDRASGAGCLTDGEARSLTGRIVENVAMPSSLAYQLTHGNFIATGYLDLSPDYELTTAAPLLKPGVTAYRGADDIAGFETARYEVRRRGDGGVRIVLRGVEQNFNGKISPATKPLTELISLPVSARYVRYYFRTWSVSADRRIALLATSRPEMLEAASRKFEADPERYCRSVPEAEAACISVPTRMSIVPELRVFVNGESVLILAGGNLGHALRAAGAKDPKSLASRLRVLRRWGGAMLPVEFDRQRGDILGLVPIGGEQIRW